MHVRAAFGSIVSFVHTEASWRVHGRCSADGASGRGERIRGSDPGDPVDGGCLSGDCISGGHSVAVSALGCWPLGKRLLGSGSGAWLVAAEAAVAATVALSASPLRCAIAAHATASPSSRAATLAASKASAGSSAGGVWRRIRSRNVCERSPFASKCSAGSRCRLVVAILARARAKRARCSLG